jgi:hypothetical protein
LRSDWNFFATDWWSTCNGFDSAADRVSRNAAGLINVAAMGVLRADEKSFDEKIKGWMAVRRALDQREYEEIKAAKAIRVIWGMLETQPFSLDLTNDLGRSPHSLLGVLIGGEKLMQMPPGLLFGRGISVDFVKSIVKERVESRAVSNEIIAAAIDRLERIEYLTYSMRLDLESKLGDGTHASGLLLSTLLDMKELHMNIRDLRRFLVTLQGRCCACGR